MALKIKSINWRNIRLPAGINSNLYIVTSAIEGTDWKLIQYEEKTFKLIITNGACKMAIYLSTMTVQTAMKHPKKGKTQLTRKNITAREFNKLVLNPREHTGKGHY